MARSLLGESLGDASKDCLVGEHWTRLFESDIMQETACMGIEGEKRAAGRQEAAALTKMKR